ncbi:solute carrier family 2, facilitated glucose transporter member 11-like [Gastrophryne carolinensis]
MGGLLSEMVHHWRLLPLIFVLGLGSRFPFGFNISVISLSSSVHHWRLLPLVIVLGLGSGLPFGFNISVIGSSSSFVQNFINQTWVARYGFSVPEGTLTLLWSMIASLYSVGGLLGSLAAGYLTQRFGKRRSQMLSNVVGLAASLNLGLSKIAGSFEMLLAGRLLYGVAMGLAINIYLQYLGEAAPRSLRGFTNTTAPLFVVSGRLFGQIVGLKEVLGTETLWPLMLSVCGLCHILQLIVMRFYPETPAHFLLVKSDQERCKKAMDRLWGPGNYQSEVQEMLAEQEMRKNAKTMTVMEVVKDRTFRWQLILIYFYARSVFLNSGLAAEKIPYISLGMGSFELLSIMLCITIIERCGRKVLLLSSYGLMAIMLVLLTVTISFQWWADWIPYCSAVFIFLFIFFYGLGPGTLTVALLIEICSHSTRAAVFVIVSSLNWIGIYIIGMSFPFIVGAVGHYCFLFFILCIVGSGTFLFVFLPETKGKTSQQIASEFNKLNFKDTKDPKPIELSTSM